VGYAITRLPEDFTPHRQIGKVRWGCSPVCKVHPVGRVAGVGQGAVWSLAASWVSTPLQVYEARRNMVESGEGIDWGMGEALAFGTLLAEGEPNIC